MTRGGVLGVLSLIEWRFETGGFGMWEEREERCLRGWFYGVWWLRHLVVLFLLHRACQCFIKRQYLSRSTPTFCAHPLPLRLAM